MLIPLWLRQSTGCHLQRRAPGALRTCSCTQATSLGRCGQMVVFLFVICILMAPSKVVWCNCKRGTQPMRACDALSTLTCQSVALPRSILRRRCYFNKQTRTLTSPERMQDARWVPCHIVAQLTSCCCYNLAVGLHSFILCCLRSAAGHCAAWQQRWMRYIVVTIRQRTSLALPQKCPISSSQASQRMCCHTRTVDDMQMCLHSRAPLCSPGQRSLIWCGLAWLIKRT